LAALRDGELVLSAVAQALGVRATGQRPILESVTALLRTQTVLLVLDNCEHLLEAVATCAHALVAQAPRLRVLLTTQELVRAAVSRPIDGGLSTDGGLARQPRRLSFSSHARRRPNRGCGSDANLASVGEICRT
jgi:predicted ATPase